MLPLLRIMEERGGESAERVEQLGVLLAELPLRDGVPGSDALTDLALLDELNLPALILSLEADYNVEIKG